MRTVALNWRVDPGFVNLKRERSVKSHHGDLLEQVVFKKALVQLQDLPVVDCIPV